MKPITFWVQNDAINQLVAKYGSTLERLRPGTRRELIACLSTGGQVYYWGRSAPELEQIYPLLAALTRLEKDLLMEAIAATLTHQGNPWVENARANVALEQAQKKAPLYTRDAI